jgi:hypothetical protein
MVEQTVFQVIVVLVGALSTIAAALFYFRRIRLERPAIGCFNGRDVVILFGFIVTLPVLYLYLPPVVLTIFLVITFVSALSIGYRPVVPPTLLWPAIGLLIGTNIIVARNLLGTTRGWQLYWTLTSVAVLLAAVAVANLYIQGGMRLRHVAWLALGLAIYDPIFSFGIPLTAKLADAFAGHPLDPSIGFRAGLDSANIGIGDLLVYSAFAVAAYKGYGRRGVAMAFGLVAVFGGLAPSLAPLVISAVVRGNIGVVVPAQLFFGPAAFIGYRILARSGPERTMREWRAVNTEEEPKRRAPFWPNAPVTNDSLSGLAY